MAEDKKLEESFFKKLGTELAAIRTTGQAKKVQRDAIKWYTGKLKETIPDRVPQSVLLAKRKAVSKFLPGNMFAMRYDSKLFEEGRLAYYDAAPLIIFLKPQDNGNLLGLNLHYLPPPVRLKILGFLMKNVRAKKVRHDVRLPVNYQKLQSISQLKPLQFAIKSYIPSRIHGKIVRVQPNEWAYATSLPTMSPVGASARGIWRDNPHI